MMPHVSAAVSAYGGAVLVKARDDSVDDVAGLSRSLLQRVFRQRNIAEPLPEPLAGMAVDAAIGNGRCLTGSSVSKVLTANPVLRVRGQSMPAATAGAAQRVEGRKDPHTAAKDQAVIDYRPMGE
jgi:hypothetical protein